MLANVFKEPLVQFLMLGACLFGVQTLVGTKKTAHDVIEIGATEMAPVVENWKVQYGREPNPQERQSLVDAYIREEVLVREALALGLDRNDTVIRHRLTTKLLFLSDQWLKRAEPDAATLSTWFQKNRERYLTPQQFSFSHIFFSEDLRGTRAEAEAKALLDKLASNDVAARTSAMGDRFMLAADYALVSQQQIARDFGTNFANHLAQAPIGVWQGPIRSAYGFHLLFVGRSDPAHLPSLEKVQTQVALDYRSEEQHQEEERFYQTLRARYSIRTE